MDEDFFALTAAERGVLDALNRQGVRYSSAIGNRLDVVTHMSGLGKFEEEAANTTQLDLDGVPVLVLKLERIIASKQAAGRKKDLAIIPALEEALAAIRG